MGDFERHINLLKEKQDQTYNAFIKENFSVVGDLAVKAIEQAIEADAARQKIPMDLGDHNPRFNYLRKISFSLYQKFRSLFWIYGDLGYDGKNGVNARKAIGIMNEILEFFVKRWGEKIEIRTIENLEKSE